MPQAKVENLRSVYILLFLNIAFFFLEHQDPSRYAALFAFDRDAVFGGEIWRLFTWQFTQSGQGWFAFPRAVVLFFTLLLLYLMGTAVEEEWGSVRFLSLFMISTIASAAAAAFLNIPLLGSYFVNFSLLFVYAAMFPNQTFYMFGALPVRIRWIAWIAAVVLVAGVFAGGAANTAALVGSVAAYSYFVALRIAVVAPAAVKGETVVKENAVDSTAIRNASRSVAIRRAVASRSATEIDRLTGQLERDILRGVNICPPADFKPDHSDGYCIRCEGFSECAVRLLMMNRPPADPPADAKAIPEATS